MNENKLKGYIVEKGETYSSCAEATNMSITAFSNKMNGKSSFDIIEINALVHFLKMDIDTASEIFLQNNLHNMQERR